MFRFLKSLAFVVLRYFVQNEDSEASNSVIFLLRKENFAGTCLTFFTTKLSGGQEANYKCEIKLVQAFL